MVLLRFDKEKDDWIRVDQKDKIKGDLYLDGFQYEKLLFAKKQLSKNHDAGGLVCGPEGSGKSSLAGNIMRFMTNDKFDPVKDIIKDQGDAIRVLTTIPDGSAVMFDEAYMLFLSTETMKKGQRDLVKIFSIIRQKNLFFLIVGPSFFRMNSYFALDRTKFMINVYTGPANERGYFSYYGEKSKAKLYRMGKKDHNFQAVKPDFRGRFTTCYLLENKEYMDVKKETLMSAFKEAEGQKTMSRMEVEKLLTKKIVVELAKKGFNQTQVGEAVGVSRSTVKRWYKDWKIASNGPAVKVIGV